MKNSSDHDDGGINQDLAAAILGANCSTGMAVAAGLTGAGFAVAFPVVVVGAAAGILLKHLLSDWDADNQ